MSPGARLFLLAWGTLGIVLFLYALVARRRGRSTASSWRSTLRLLWPLFAFDAVVVVSLFNPTLLPVAFEEVRHLQLTDPPHAWLPTSARPDLAWRELWHFNAIVLSCFNAFLVLRRRRELRLLLGIVAANALVLAMLGTFQKLGGAKGLWFGLVETPQPYFFATFVYHNHWGAFTMLNAAACLGLLFHVFHRGGDRDLWHSPLMAGALAVLLLAATTPLSGSRSSTALLLVFLAGALVHFLLQIVRRRRAASASSTGPIMAVVMAAMLALGGIVFLSQDVIARRSRHTAEQVAQIRASDMMTSRLVLYRDTWRMASDRPWFGWGLQSYPDIFRVYNSQRAVETWFGQPFYRDAHSDWLQSLAEKGFVGTGLLCALAIAPLFAAMRRGRFSALPRYLIVGVVLVAAYAWVEFPFANPSVMIAFWTSLYVAARYALSEREAQKPGVSHD